jgi:cytochrome c-type biogenesis protein CcmH/NrfG
MDASTERSKMWSNAQTYGLAIICLAVGVITGYLLHAPKQTVAGVPQAPSAMNPANGAAPTDDQIARMGDKMAAPLLASLQKDPNNATLLAQLGSVYFRSQQFPLSAEYYERAVKAKPDAEVYVSLSNSYFYAGASDKAIDALNRALEKDPKSANALFNLGMLKWRVKNDPKAAIADWERLLKENPKHPRRAEVESMIAQAKKHMKMPAQDKAVIQ